MKNGKDIYKSINKEGPFYLCQSTFMIRNAFAYNCCDYNIELDVCEYIPPTIFTTDIISTTNALLESTKIY